MRGTRIALKKRGRVLHGHATQKSMRKARNVLTELFSSPPHMTPVEARLINDMKGIIVFRVKVEEVTGMAEEW